MKFKRSTADRPGWETLSSETHFESDHLAVVTEEIRSPANRKPRRWTVVHRKAAVVIAPMTSEGRLILVRQERIPIRQAIWEMPAGQIDDASDDETGNARAVALRELREETGYELAPSGELIELGDFLSSPGFTDERAYLFLARPVVAAPNGPEHSEAESILEIRAFASAEIARMIASNEIRDANTLAICARLVARGLLSLGA